MALTCLRAMWWTCTLLVFFMYFSQFTLNHFTLNILLHWHFCSCCFARWTMGNCAWQSSLWHYYRAQAWLQSSSIFISSLLFLTFGISCMWASRSTHALKCSCFLSLYTDWLFFVDFHTFSNVFFWEKHLYKHVFPLLTIKLLAYCQCGKLNRKY